MLTLTEYLVLPLAEAFAKIWQAHSNEDLGPEDFTDLAEIALDGLAETSSDEELAFYLAEYEWAIDNGQIVDKKYFMALAAAAANWYAESNNLNK